jgi:hypothetical protein
MMESGARPGQRSAAPTDALRQRYERYRQQQGRDLLPLIPREGIRALLRHRVERSRPIQGWGNGSDELEPDFAMEELAAVCADLLPLPPFEVWLADFRSNRAAHLENDGSGRRGPVGPDGAPVTIAVRSFLHDGEAWTAELVVREDPPDWCGRLHFHRGGTEPLARTGEIFRDAQASLIRERWRRFDDRSLEALLRSALS